MRDSEPLSVTDAADAIRTPWPAEAKLGVVLGSGLGQFVEAVEVQFRLPYASIPGFPVSTAIGHAGELVCGTLEGKPIALLRGRSHLYEGYSREQVTFGVRVLAELGVEALLLSCAAGGLNPLFEPGDLMLIRDHVDLLKTRGAGNRVRQAGTSARRGAATPRFGADRPMTDAKMNEHLAEIARAHQIRLREGTYVAVTGPNYETRTELRFLRTIADAVGMSTVPEITAAAEMGIPVAAIALITNSCRPDAPQETTGEQVLAIASSAELQFRTLVREYLSTV